VGVEAQEPTGVEPQVGVPFLRVAQTVQGRRVSLQARGARPAATGRMTVTAFLTVTLTATAAVRGCPGLSFGRDPSGEAGTIRRGNGVPTRFPRVGDAGFGPATSSL
jgi:hypothetical protein